MIRFAQTTAEITSFHYNVDLTLAGRLNLSLVPDVSSATIKLSGDVVNKDPNSPKFTLAADLAGVAPSGSLAIVGELINLDDYTYFRLTNLTVPTLLPVSLGADSRWYKIRHVAANDPNEKKLGVADGAPITNDQLQAVRDLLKQTPLMEVVEVMSDETVNNQRSYHFRAQFKPEALVTISQQLGQLLGLSQPDQTLGDLADYQPEIWINKRTFQLSQLKLADIYLRDNIPLAFDLMLGLSRHNESFKITAPQATDEIDPTKLLQEQFGF